MKGTRSLSPFKEGAGIDGGAGVLTSLADEAPAKTLISLGVSSEVSPTVTPLLSSST